MSHSLHGVWDKVATFLHYMLQAEEAVQEMVAATPFPDKRNLQLTVWVQAAAAMLAVVELARAPPRVPHSLLVEDTSAQTVSLN